MKKLALLAVVASVLLSGCTVRVADLTLGSTKNYNLNSAKFQKGPRVIGEDTYPVILFPLGIPNMKTAIDNAIQQDKCAVALTDLVISHLNHNFLVGKVGIRVEGNLVLDKSQPGCK